MQDVVVLSFTFISLIFHLTVMFSSVVVTFVL